MLILWTMAFGGCPKEAFAKDVMRVKRNSTFGENSGEKELSRFQNKEKTEFMEIPKRKYCDCLNFITSKNADESREKKLSEKDDIHPESLSSSASISDSDITSTDSEDSLALSESESITDVTPLNSPYCDSPLPQPKNSEYKSEDLPVLYASQKNEIGSSSSDCSHPEANVLMKAIEKLELEAKSSSGIDYHGNFNKMKTGAFPCEEIKKVDPDNKLYKRVISQNRIKSMYASPDQLGSKPFSNKFELVKSDVNTSGAHKKLPGKLSKDGNRYNLHRKQKCLSHPSSFVHSCQHMTDKDFNQ